MAIKYDISYINWTKAAFCASLRALFSPSATCQINMINGLTALDTQIIYSNHVGEPFLKDDIILIENEICLINQVDLQNNILTVTRGYQNTIAVPHTNGTQIIKSYVPFEYLFLNDEELTKILIYTAFPLRNFNSPLIIVNVSGGNASVRSVGPQEQLEIRTINGEKHVYFSGILQLNVRIDIYASSVTDVEKLLDFVVVFLRFFLRDKLAELNITYTQVTINDLRTIEWNGQLLYSSSISIANCNSQYELIFPYPLLNFVDNLNITMKIEDFLNNLNVQNNLENL